MFNTTKTLDIIESPYNFYVWTLTEGDSRTKGWLLVDSPIPVICWIFLYLFVVLMGPRLMRDRKAFNIERLMVPYNLFMSLLNAYICWQLLASSIRLNYSYICEPSRRIHHPADHKIVKAVWWFYFSKLLEFSDTLFFVLRKKQNQLTFLHVYHHSTMFPIWWLGVKWVPSGSSCFPAMINSFIHIIMYLYYGLSVLGPKMQKILRWKKYLTVLQLIQFSAAIVVGINGIIAGCDYPVWMHYSLILYMTSFIILFGKFYKTAYTDKMDKINCKKIH